MRETDHHEHAEPARPRRADHPTVAAARERAALAGEIHDSAVQEVFVAQMRLRLARQSMTVRRSRTLSLDLDFVDRHLEDALRSMRKVMAGITPQVETIRTLTEAIDAAVLDVVDDFGLDVAIAIDHTAPTLCTDRVSVVHRVTLEALRNVGKHAATMGAWVSSRVVDQLLEVEVRDDGRGMPASASAPDVLMSDAIGFGLANAAVLAHGHGGRLSLVSEPGEGTLVRLQLPL